MNIWMYFQNTSKCLWHGDDTGVGLFIANGVGHQLLDGLISEPCQLS